VRIIARALAHARSWIRSWAWGVVPRKVHEEVFSVKKKWTWMEALEKFLKKQKKLGAWAIRLIKK
jgi:hypothetical protein